MRVTLVLTLISITSIAACASEWWGGKVDTVEQYWSNGQLKKRSVQKTDTLGDGGTIPEGPYLSWHENGTRELQGGYWEGYREGWWQSWHTNGQLKEQGEYQNSMRVGAWPSYHDNGILAAITRYSNGKKHGLCLEWHPNGRLAHEARYAEEELHGICQWFDDQGRIVRTEVYLKGALLINFWPKSTEFSGHIPGQYHNAELDMNMEWTWGTENLRVGRIIDGYKQGAWTFFLNHLEQAIGSREVIYEKGTIVRR